MYFLIIIIYKHLIVSKLRVFGGDKEWQLRLRGLWKREGLDLRLVSGGCAKTHRLAQ